MSAMGPRGAHREMQICRLRLLRTVQACSYGFLLQQAGEQDLQLLAKILRVRDGAHLSLQDEV